MSLDDFCTSLVLVYEPTVPIEIEDFEKSIEDKLHELSASMIYTSEGREVIKRFFFFVSRMRGIKSMPVNAICIYTRLTPGQYTMIDWGQAVMAQVLLQKLGDTLDGRVSYKILPDYYV